MKIRMDRIYQQSFFLLILALALFPFASRSRSISLFNDLFSLEDALIVLITVFSLPVFLLKSDQKSTAKSVYRLFLILLVWAFITTSFSPNGGLFPYWYIIYPLIMGLFSVILPYLISKTASDSNVDREKMIISFTYVLTFILTYYIYKDLTGPPLIRLAGGLGPASVVHSIMIPMLAVHVTNYMQKSRRLLSFIGIIITIGAIFLTGSRAGLISLLLLGVYLLFRSMSIKRFFTFLVPVAIAVVVILQSVNTHRYQSFEDIARSTNLHTALRFSFDSVGVFVFGNGFGSIYPYYGREKFDPAYHLLHDTQFGYVLHHAHSVALEVLSEMGAVGLVVFLVLLWVVVKQLFKSRKETGNQMRTNLLAAMVCTFPSLLLDTYFFKLWPISIIWWFYLFAALSYQKSKADLQTKEANTT